MQYQLNSSTDSFMETPRLTRFQTVRARLRKVLFIVALTGAAYSRLNAAPVPNRAIGSAHPHHAAIKCASR